METGWDPGNPDLKKRIFNSGQSLQALSEVKLQVQSLKRSAFPFYCAFTCNLPSAPFELTFHKALTVRSQSVLRSLSVHLSFSLFSFGTPKWKIRSLRVTKKWEKKTCIKVEGILIHYTSKNIILIRIQSEQFKVHIFEPVRFL